MAAELTVVAAFYEGVLVVRESSTRRVGVKERAFKNSGKVESVFFFSRYVVLTLAVPQDSLRVSDLLCVRHNAAELLCAAVFNK